MKELQKHYAENVLSTAVDEYGPFYLASEADAAFAEMRRSLADQERATEGLKKYCDSLIAHIAALKQQHAEEIQRLKAEHHALVKAELKTLRATYDHIIIERDQQVKHLRKQAERYEKLRRLTSKEVSEVWLSRCFGNGNFDSLVDQLPASGEEKK